MPNLNITMTASGSTREIQRWIDALERLGKAAEKTQGSLNRVTPPGSGSRGNIAGSLVGAVAGEEAGGFAGAVAGSVMGSVGLGAILTATGAALGKMFASLVNKAVSQVIPQQLAMGDIAMRLGPVNQLNALAFGSVASRYGYKPEEATQFMGIFGSIAGQRGMGPGGAGYDNALRLSRLFGFQPEEGAQFTGGVTREMGGDLQMQERFADILAGAISRGRMEGREGEVFRSILSATTQIGQRLGLTSGQELRTAGALGVITAGLDRTNIPSFMGASGMETLQNMMGGIAATDPFALPPGTQQAIMGQAASNLTGTNNPSGRAEMTPTQAYMAWAAPDWGDKNFAKLLAEEIRIANAQPYELARLEMFKAIQFPTGTSPETVNKVLQAILGGADQKKVASLIEEGKKDIAKKEADEKKNEALRTALAKLAKDIDKLGLEFLDLYGKIYAFKDKIVRLTTSVSHDVITTAKELISGFGTDEARHLRDAAKAGVGTGMGDQGKRLRTTTAVAEAGADLLTKAADKLLTGAENLNKYKLPRPDQVADLIIKGTGAFVNELHADFQTLLKGHGWLKEMKEWGDKNIAGPLNALKDTLGGNVDKAVKDMGAMSDALGLNRINFFDPFGGKEVGEAVPPIGHAAEASKKRVFAALKWEGEMEKRLTPNPAPWAPRNLIGSEDTTVLMPGISREEVEAGGWMAPSWKHGVINMPGGKPEGETFNAAIETFLDKNKAALAPEFEQNRGTTRGFAYQAEELFATLRPGAHPEAISVTNKGKRVTVSYRPAGGTVDYKMDLGLNESGNYAVMDDTGGF